MNGDHPTLHSLCGKIASGKSTLAAQLAAAPGLVLIGEDVWLEAVFADQLHSLEDYARCSAKLRAVMGPHAAALLDAGLSVVLDFPANTPRQREWAREIAKSAGVSHFIHFLDVPDDVCLARLQERNAAGAHPFTVSDALFHEVTRHFTSPTANEGCTIVVHASGEDTPEA